MPDSKMHNRQLGSSTYELLLLPRHNLKSTPDIYDFLGRATIYNLHCELRGRHWVVGSCLHNNVST